ncbi:MAG: glycosyltransferase family 4 protein [Terracidiphilus sp.]
MNYRAVHLTSVHYAFDTRIFHRECKSLALAGYDVTLIAPHSGSDQCLNDIKLRTVKPPADRRERMTKTIWAVYRAALRENADIYHFHDPELLPIGVLLKLRGKRVIYDVHEDYKGTMEGKQWLPSAFHKPAAIAVDACEQTLGRACDRIIAATPTIARKFRPERARLVQNYPWLNELQSPNAPSHEKREAIAIFVGWLGDHSGMESMGRAIELAAKKLPMKLLIAGKLKPGALATFQTGATNKFVEYLGFLSRPQVAELIARARVGMVTVLPLDNYVNAQPTKMFEYMSGGVPVIASDFPVYRKIVESADCGLLVDPLNPTAIADAILWIMQNPSQAAKMGQNGQRAIADKYNWEREAASLIATYEELLPTRC